jgi:hypothetical protein
VDHEALGGEPTPRMKAFLSLHPFIQSRFKSRFSDAEGTKGCCLLKIRSRTRGAGHAFDALVSAKLLKRRRSSSSFLHSVQSGVLNPPE